MTTTTQGVEVSDAAAAAEGRGPDGAAAAEECRSVTDACSLQIDALEAPEH